MKIPCFKIEVIHSQHTMRVLYKIVTTINEMIGKMLNMVKKLLPISISKIEQESLIQQYLL